MREEVQNVLQFIQDSLRAADIPHEAEPTEENPNTCVICACDKAGYENIGIIGWNEERAGVSYAAFNPMVARHDEMEGVNENESKCWWSPRTAEQMVWHLNGKVREIVREEIARKA